MTHSSPSCNGFTDSSQHDPFFEAVKVATVAAFTAMSYPRLYNIARRFPVFRELRFFHAHRELFEKGRAAVTNSKATSTRRNLFAKVLEQAEDDDEKITQDDICAEAAGFMIAGSDTTSNTLTYLIWAVLSDRSVQEGLEDEVSALSEPLTDSDLDRLPVLHAVIQETLRLHGAAPTPEPRVVPQDGAYFGSHYLPAGTVVSTQAWTMHRNPDIFHEPES